MGNLKRFAPAIMLALCRPGITAVVPASWDPTLHARLAAMQCMTACGYRLCVATDGFFKPAACIKRRQLLQYSLVTGFDILHMMLAYLQHMHVYRW